MMGFWSEKAPVHQNPSLGSTHPRARESARVTCTSSSFSAPASVSTRLAVHPNRDLFHHSQVHLPRRDLHLPGSPTIPPILQHTLPSSRSVEYCLSSSPIVLGLSRHSKNRTRAPETVKAQTMLPAALAASLNPFHPPFSYRWHASPITTSGLSGFNRFRQSCVSGIYAEAARPHPTC